LTKKLLGELELNRIYQRDCLEGMAMIPDKSVDLIVIDPPYNIGKDKRWDKWQTVEEYVNWMTEVFKECERVLKDNGSFYWFHNDMAQIRRLMDSLDVTSFVYKQLITWSKVDSSFKNYGYVQQRLSIDMMRNYYNGFTEYCVYYTLQSDDFHVEEQRKYLYDEWKTSGLSIAEIKRMCGFSGNMPYHWFAPSLNEGKKSQWQLPTEQHYKTLQSTGYFTKPYEELKNGFVNSRYVFNNAIVKDELRANSNVWLYPPAKNLGHVTPKPVEMIENIIHHSSNDGDIVLDCFMGSGTTAVAATRLNRNFIGFERESEYVRIANQRLEAVQDELAERKLTEE
jgi:DNA modification methylase